MIDITNNAEYSECISQINLWYGSDAQKIIDIANTWELTPEQLTTDWLSGSGYEPWYSSSGAVGGYNATGTSAINYATAAQESINSNAGSVTQVALKTPVEQTLNQSGKVVTSGGLTSVATGAKSALTFVATDVLPAVNAAGLGIALGKKFDAALYNAFPDFWDNIGMSTLNPETWNDITKDYPDGFLKKAFNTIFGLNPSTGETQQYLDAEAAAYLAMYMQEKGIFAAGEETVTTDELSFNTYQPPYTVGGTPEFHYIYRGQRRNYVYTPTDRSHFVSFINPAKDHGLIIGASATQGATLYVMQEQSGSFNPTYTTVTTEETATYNGKTVYFTARNHSIPGGYTDLESSGWGNEVNNITTTEKGKIAWCLVYGTHMTSPTIDGVTDQDNATLPNFAGCETPEDYLAALQNQYPNLFNNAVTQSIINPDGTSKTKTYIPIGTPSKNNNGNKTQPVTNTDNSGNKQSDSNANPNNLDLTGLENLIKTLTETISQTGTPTNPTNPDPTGTGNTPPVVVPTGNASALWSVYNPSQAELNSFGAWLWSSNFIDQILKLFNNPMQSIIGVHKIFAAPPVSGSGSITVGYLNSGVSANLVSGQYTTVNCGTVKVKEQFGNVFDYTDTHIRLYLPFIGIVDLDTADVMRGSVSVVYHVDVITGACLAEVKVTRDGSGGTLYQFAGDAAVRYPISSGSYMGVVSGVLGVVGGIASGIMSGGATLPMAAGAIASGMSHAKTQVQHSGSFAGNAGAMGGKKPYLIIERPQTAIANGYGAYQGTGANNIVSVGAISGYFKMTDVHLDGIARATESELSEIENLLLKGVIT